MEGKYTDKHHHIGKALLHKEFKHFIKRDRGVLQKQARIIDLG